MGLAAAGVLGYGLYQIYRGVAGNVTKRLALGSLGADARRWVARVSRFGIAARGVVFVLIGTFLVRAALERDPSEASGVAAALRALARNEHGPWLLGRSRPGSSPTGSTRPCTPGSGGCGRAEELAGPGLTKRTIVLYF